jgi:DNA-binding SARP family transcriptional activator
LEAADGDRRVSLPRGRASALLAILALRPGEVVSTDRLIDHLWGETPPPTARKALQGLVSALRTRLEPEHGAAGVPAVIGTRTPGYVLLLDREHVDAHRFRRLVERASAASGPTKAVLLRDALALWRGPALDEFRYEPFAQTAIADLEELRLSALEERIEADLSIGRHAEVVAELEGLAAEHPLRERLRAQLILALYRCGRQADALACYQETRRHMVNELGIEPGPTLQALERKILTQDPSLAAPEYAGPRADASTAPDWTGSWLTAARKVVTVLFADLSVTVSGRDTPDPERSRLAGNHAYEVAVDVVGRHGGNVEGFLGDVVVAVFGVPVAHEDDAMRAVRAACELRRSMEAARAETKRDYGVRFSCRIGINSGEVVVGDPTARGPATSGAAVALAARLQQAAAAGEVLLGEPTRRLVGGAALVEPVEDRTGLDADTKGMVWRLVDLAEASASAPPGGAFVGRDLELEWLHRAFESTLGERHAALVAVVGDAGVGKSRLFQEFAAEVRDQALVATGRCHSYGDGLTFGPLRQVVEALAGSSGTELRPLLSGEPGGELIVDRVAGSIGLAEGTASASELFPVVRRLLEMIAQLRPTVVALEDAHWAQPTLLDLLEYVTESTRQPLLLVCLARPGPIETRLDRRDNRPSSSTLLRLEPLGPEHSHELVSHRLGTRALPQGTLERVIELGQGNPLFLEQLLAALREEEDIELPPSVQALLAARLDRLGPAERDLLRCASVPGPEFSVEALSALLPADAIRFAVVTCARWNARIWSAGRRGRSSGHRRSRSVTSSSNWPRTAASPTRTAPNCISDSRDGSKISQVSLRPPSRSSRATTSNRHSSTDAKP